MPYLGKNDPLKQARIAVAKQDTENRLLRNLAAKKELVAAKAVENEVLETMRELRAGVLVLPSKIYQLVPDATIEQKQGFDKLAHELLQSLVRRALKVIGDEEPVAEETQKALPARGGPRKGTKHMPRTMPKEKKVA